MNNQTNNTNASDENNIPDEAKTNKKENDKHISVQTANKILICLIFVLLAYIIGMQIINSIKTDISNDNHNTNTTVIPETTVSADYTVNINTDDPFELTRLEGIGEAKARAIIEYRKENGDFISIDEIKNVQGIGDNLYEKIKKYLTIN